MNTPKAAPVAVEAAERLKSLIDQYWSLAYREGTEGRTRDTEDGAAQATLHEINKTIAALTSQQEVAAPVGPTPEMIAAFKAAFQEGSIWEDRVTAGLRAALAASRDQVNLAAQSRAAEAVGAVPVTDDGMCKSCVNDKCVTGPECVTLGRDTRPPAGYVLVPILPTRAMEDAAIRELGWCPEDVAAAERDDDERVDLRVTYTAMILASQPKAPAPGPVAQGEAMTDEQIYHQARGDYEIAQIRRTKGTRECWPKFCALTPIEQAGWVARSCATPPGGAGGDVGASPCQHDQIPKVHCFACPETTEAYCQRDCQAVQTAKGPGE